MYLNLFTVHWIGWSKTVWHKTLHWLVWHFFKHCHLRLKKKLLLPFSSSVFQSDEFVFKIFKTFLGALLLKFANFAILSKNLQILPFCPKICNELERRRKTREGGQRPFGKTLIHPFLPSSIRFTWLYIMICWWLPPSRCSKQHNPN